MQNAVAFSNNDVVTIAWSMDKKPAGCMGFAVFRIDEKRVETPLPSHAVFAGQKIAPGQTTKEFPLQKFYWKDVYARLIAEKTGNRKFRYKIVPLEGKPGALVAMASAPFMITNEVEISPIVSDNISVFFNRGLISTQRIARAFEGDPTKAALIPRVSDPKDELRASLSGDMLEALTGFLDKAKDSGKIYAALYELGDVELITKLKGIGSRLNIVLSNSLVKVDDTSKPKKVGKDGVMRYPTKDSDANQPARDALHALAGKVYDRIMPGGHIGHNKFLIYVDDNDVPQAVLCGSTNWTPTGLCTQTNNSMVISDSGVAQHYLAYWNELAKDTDQAAGTAKALQGKLLRGWAQKNGTTFKVPGTTGVDSWFSPNTPAARGSNSSTELRPADLKVVEKYIQGAKQAILFLAFYPGSPSIANWSAAALAKNKNLFVRGCVTNNSASEGFYYELRGAVPPKRTPGEKISQDLRVFAAEAFDHAIPDQWQKELLSAGFAIIHDKVMVIDPFSDDCVVITGSHNLGHKASYDNDENLIIVKGNKKLAMAYASHVLDVYDHFSARYAFKHAARKENNYYLKENPDDWMGRYFDASGNIKGAQLKFWMNANGN